MSAASAIRKTVEASGERTWRVSDFADMPVLAVSQALSRLAKSGVLTRTGKGNYYHPRPTVFGQSKPSDSDIGHRYLGGNARPAGRTAANLLGFTTQNPAIPEYATSANIASPTASRQARIYTRRPESWNRLSDEDAALLDFIRSRAIHSDLGEQETVERLTTLLTDGRRFERLAAVADDEPPRVRAMLGAIGQQIGAPAEVLGAIHSSLNPLSRFDFGRLRALHFAREWQAK